VVDDEPNVLYSLEKGLRSDALDVVTAATGRQAVELVRTQPPDAVILDVRLTDMSGLDAFDQMRRLDPHLPVIVITAFAPTETATGDWRGGALEYLLRPVDFHQLQEVVARALEQSRLRHVPAVLPEEAPAEGGAVDCIVGRCPAMQEVYKAIG